MLVNHGMVMKYTGRERTSYYCEALRLRIDIKDTFGMLQCLERLSELAIEAGHFDRAAGIFGAQAALEDDGRIKLAAHHTNDHTRNLALIQQRLGERSFSSNWELGRRAETTTILREFL